MSRFIADSSLLSHTEVFSHSVQTRFEAQVAQTPDALAVLCGNEQLTYRDLNRRANQLAGALLALGITPGDRVAVCMERSIELVVALVGILKSGAAYLPLDPSDPPHRLAGLLADAQASVLLTLTPHVAALPAERPITLRLDTAWSAALTEQGEVNPPASAGLESLLALLYTSGSSGHPKGVCIPHRSVLRLVTDPTYVHLSPADRVACASSVAFDALTFEIWGALLNGACLVIFSKALLLSPHEFAQALSTAQITTLFLTTALFHQYAHLLPEAFHSLQTLLVGGEALRPAAVRAVLASRPPRRLLNVYGPTENTTFSTWYEVQQVSAEATSIPIGTPISGTDIFVLDAALHPVASGEPGELYLGGDGVALGYWQQPRLTAERFLPASDGTHPGTLLYKTGDLVRQRPDGLLEFLGRLDTQVKIRGFRVEVEELEQVLSHHPAISAACVVVQEQEEAKHLHAYLLLRQPADQVTFADLHAWLQARLPAPLLPDRLVVLEYFPLTRNGKVDRAALPHCSGREVRPEVADPDDAPTEREQRIITLCADLLHRPDVPRQQDFATLGLDSLQRAILASRLAAALHLPESLVLRLSLEHPSVQALAQALAASGAQPLAAPSQKDHAHLPPRSMGGPPAFVTITSEPLFTTLRRSEQAPLDAAALAYLPALTAQEQAAVAHWSAGHPVLTHVVQTPLGRIGLFALPIQVQDLYVRKPEVLALSQEAVEQAQMVGARVVALTGLLPSALEYGHLLAQALAGRQGPLLTTGHATTTAAIVLNIAHLLTLTGRDLSQERVACVGMGSIGMTTLQVLLRLQPHPASLLLCDLYSHRPHLEALAKALRAQGYCGDVLMGEASAGTVADAVYQATMLIGATNAANVVDIDRLAPGCLLIDDSGPHCFDPKLAWERMQRQQDLLAIEAGELTAPFSMQEQCYVPAGAVQIEHLMKSEEMIALREHAQEIMGCLVTGVISLALQVPTTLGHVQAQVSQQHYEALVRAGFGAAAPHLGNTLIPEPLLERFQQRFGAQRSKGAA